MADLGQNGDWRRQVIESDYERLRDEHNRRVLLGEMGEPVPDDLVCPWDGGYCDDLRCRHFGCLTERLERP